MKKLLLSVLGLLLMAGVASAGWSLKQKEDGGAYWLNDKDGREEHVLVTRLVVQVSPLASPVSTFVISPITGTIEKIYSVISKALGQGPNETITFLISNATSGDFTTVLQEVTNGVSRLTLAQITPSVAGDMREFTPNSATANRVAKGGRIAISNSGTTTATGAMATFTIIINPK